MTNQTNVQLSGVAETLLIPLYFRAKETLRPDALVKDEEAAMLIKQLDYDFSRIKLQKHDEVAIILRFERPEPRLGSMQMMRHIPAIRKASGVFHYRLGEAEVRDA